MRMCLLRMCLSIAGCVVCFKGIRVNFSDKVGDMRVACQKAPSVISSRRNADSMQQCRDRLRRLRLSDKCTLPAVLLHTTNRP